MNHVFYGATIPFVIGAILYIRRGGRATPAMLAWIPLAMAFMALWAVIPDLPRLLGTAGIHVPIALDLHSDLFLWHASLDGVETSAEWYAILERDSPWFGAGIAFEAAGLLAAALRELFRQEAR